jgi:hypothetical protein
MVDEEEDTTPPPVEYVFAMMNPNCPMDMENTGSQSNNNIITGSTAPTQNSFPQNRSYDPSSGVSFSNDSSSQSKSNSSARTPSALMIMRRDGEGDKTSLNDPLSSNRSSRSGYTGRRMLSSRRELSASLLNNSSHHSWANLSGYGADRPQGLSSGSCSQNSPSRPSDHLSQKFSDSYENVINKDREYDNKALFRNFSNERPNKNMHRSTSFRSDPGNLSSNLARLNVSESGSSAVVTRSLCPTPSKSVLVPKFTRREPAVGFTTIEIRQYERILGDNPSCSSGPPVTIDWEYDKNKTAVHLIDEYEFRRNKCRDDTEMILTRAERERILIDLGYSRRKIAVAVRENVKLKKKRRQTVNNLPISSIEEMLEGASRKISRILTKRRGSKYLYRQWKGSIDEDPHEHESASSSTRRSSLKRHSLTTGTDRQSEIFSTSAHNKHYDFASFSQQSEGKVVSSNYSNCQKVAEETKSIDSGFKKESGSLHSNFSLKNDVNLKDDLIKDRGSHIIGSKNDHKNISIPVTLINRRQ